jgi:hypothetical protein
MQHPKCRHPRSGPGMGRPHLTGKLISSQVTLTLISLGTKHIYPPSQSEPYRLGIPRLDMHSHCNIEL